MTTAVRRDPLDWYYLIREADDFSQRTGYGLARMWGCIRAQDYEGATEILNRLLLDERRGKIRSGGCEQKMADHARTRADWREKNLDPRVRA